MRKLKSKLTPHFKVSLAKSVIRVMGFSILLSSLSLGVAVLIIAEIVSIGEELVMSTRNMTLVIDRSHAENL